MDTTCHRLAVEKVRLSESPPPWPGSGDSPKQPFSMRGETSLRTLSPYPPFPKTHSATADWAFMLQRLCPRFNSPVPVRGQKGEVEGVLEHGFFPKLLSPRHKGSGSGGTELEPTHPVPASDRCRPFWSEFEGGCSGFPGRQLGLSAVSPLPLPRGCSGR